MIVFTRSRSRWNSAALAFLLAVVSLSTSLLAQDVDFAREVLPVLSNKCFICHGPDTEGLGEDMRRLDSFEGATADSGSGQAINPAAPAKSLLLERIHSVDAPMPPADAEKQLTDAERGLLTRWVNQGGRYAKHWAFVPPQKSLPPDTTATNGSDIIDAFIQRQLTASKLDFAPQADRTTLARRVALVLTGLPPEPNQRKQFLADTNDSAFDTLVNQLLASPRYGEHQARYWLDAVRYGDTHGLHLDNRRGIYPYRDWVVRAINQNLPLDDFITWQLAGDLLPAPSLEHKIATGFVRMNPSTAEGGAIPAEFQAKNNFDRTETLGKVLLGMSLTCARCHTHKYDPIPQTEYYQLFAFFNSTAEPSMDGNKYEYGPVEKVPADQQTWKQWKVLQATRDSIVKKAALLVGSEITLSDQQKWNQGGAEDRLAIVADDKGPFAATPIHEQAKTLAAKVAKAREAFTTTLVAKDLPKPRVTKVLRRGEYNLPVGEPLEPGTLSVMGEFPAGAPRNRLGLAQWLTAREHPLTSRVICEQNLATRLRIWSGSHSGRLRVAGTAPNPSRVARLAGRRTTGQWLGSATHAEADDS